MCVYIFIHLANSGWFSCYDKHQLLANVSRPLQPSQSFISSRLIVLPSLSLQHCEDPPHISFDPFTTPTHSSKNTQFLIRPEVIPIIEPYSRFFYFFDFSGFQDILEMVRQNPAPPSGPRASRAPRGSDKSSRSGGHAGIQKRRSGPVKVDKDGDLDMDASGGGDVTRRARRGRGRGADQTQSGGRGGVRNGIPNGGISSATSQKAILRGMAAGAANVRGPRKGFNFSKILREAAQQENGQDRGAGLQQISVTGWRRSKAASNPDGGVSDLLAFLERKATASDTRAGKGAKIVKVCFTLHVASHKPPSNFGLRSALVPSQSSRTTKGKPKSPLSRLGDLQPISRHFR